MATGEIYVHVLINIVFHPILFVQKWLICGNFKLWSQDFEHISQDCEYTSRDCESTSQDFLIKQR